MQQQGTLSNRERLVEAGIIKSTHQFPRKDLEIIESLTPQEVQSLIDIGGKLGREFLWEHGGGETAGILF